MEILHCHQWSPHHIWLLLENKVLTIQGTSLHQDNHVNYMLLKNGKYRLFIPKKSPKKDS